MWHLSTLVYCKLDYVLQKTILHLRYCNRLLSTCFHPKQRQSRNLNIVGSWALSGYCFGKGICVGGWETVQVGKEGGSVWERGSQGELHGCLSWEKPKRPESWLGKICCCEKRSCLRLLASYCVYESRLYIVLHKKNCVKNAGLCY